MLESSFEYRRMYGEYLALKNRQIPTKLLAKLSGELIREITKAKNHPTYKGATAKLIERTRIKKSRLPEET
jgi:hypothetical protein